MTGAAEMGGDGRLWGCKGRPNLIWGHITSHGRFVRINIIASFAAGSRGPAELLRTANFVSIDPFQYFRFQCLSFTTGVGTNGLGYQRRLIDFWEL